MMRDENKLYFSDLFAHCWKIKNAIVIFKKKNWDVYSLKVKWLLLRVVYLPRLRIALLIHMQNIKMRCKFKYLQNILSGQRYLFIVYI